MKKEIKNINVKSLVEEINTSTEVEEVIKVKKKREKRENGYTFFVNSGCDFILNRTTIKTNKTLVCIQSQKLLYIYDEIKGTKSEITEPKQLKSFFNDKLADDFVVEPGILNYAKEGIYKSNIDHWFNIITCDKPLIQYLVKRSLIPLNDLSYNYYNINALENCYKENPTLINEIFTKFKKRNIYEYDSVAEFVLGIYKISDLDTTRYAINQLCESSVTLDRYVDLEGFEKYNLNTRRLIDYLLFDFYKQGITRLNLTTYKDYLEQEYQYYGKVKDKYPKALLTAHKMISQKTIEKKRLESDSPRFAEIMEETEDFSYQNTLDKFKIIMPKVSMDLVDEGQYLCHCVASYVEKVNSGDCIVVFMREKEAEDIPYLTIEILPNRSVPQVEGMHKRSELTEEEILFINRWAKNKHLKITASNAILSKEKKKEIA